LFLQFSTINGVFIKNQFYDTIFALFSTILSQQRQFLAKNNSKIMTSAPSQTSHENIKKCLFPFTRGGVVLAGNV
jgi:hypothetical protein